MRLVVLVQSEETQEKTANYFWDVLFLQKDNKKKRKHKLITKI